MKWIDHHQDVQDRIAERRKETPDYEENSIPGVNFRSEDWCFRVTAMNIQVPEEQRTWSLWDFRGQETPWGPLPRGKKISPPILLKDGIPNMRMAMVLGELAKISKVARWGFGLLTAGQLLRQQLRALAAREETLRNSTPL